MVAYVVFDVKQLAVDSFILEFSTFALIGNSSVVVVVLGSNATLREEFTDLNKVSTNDYNFDLKRKCYMYERCCDDS